MPFPVVLAGGIATAIVAGLASGAAQIVLRVVASLGLGYVAYTGADALVTSSQADIMALLSGLGPNTVAMIGVLKVGTCLNIIFSAMVMRLSIFGTGQGFKRFAITREPS